MTALAERKSRELAAKRKGFEIELDFWEKRSEKGSPLEKHHTQIRRIRAMLSGLLSQIDAALSSATANGRVVEEARALERALIEAHRVWSFFRDKFALRELDAFRTKLSAADALAWACYAPAKTHAAGAVPKEPPLVCPQGGTSPFLLPRNSAFWAEEVPGEKLVTKEVKALLRAVPVPIVGIPWVELSHVPELLVIGHEVGHAVEEDLALTGTLKSLLSAANLARPAHFDAWLGEVLADVYGALALGPAFAGCLIDFLANDPQKLAREPLSKEAEYPPTAIRILIVLTVVKRRFPEQAEALSESWNTVYPHPVAAPFSTDAVSVANALAGGKYPELSGKSLEEVIGLSVAQQQSAAQTRELLLARQALTDSDPRALAAGAQLAFSKSPAEFVDRDLGSRTVARIVATEKPGTRGAPSTGTLPKATLDGDKARGAAWLARLRTAIDAGDRAVTFPG